MQHAVAQVAVGRDAEQGDPAAGAALEVGMQLVHDGLAHVGQAVLPSALPGGVARPGGGLGVGGIDLAFPALPACLLGSTRPDAAVQPGLQLQATLPKQTVNGATAAIVTFRPRQCHHV